MGDPGIWLSHILAPVDKDIPAAGTLAQKQNILLRQD